MPFHINTMVLTRKCAPWITLAALTLFIHPAWAKHTPHHAAGIRQHAPPMATTSLHRMEATVAFSPNDDATRLNIMAINGAKKRILLQPYDFTSPEIIRALSATKDRGVDVEAILDKINRSGRYSGATHLMNHHIPVWIDGSVAIAHNKVMMIDGNSIITGSFNFTRSAQLKNAENILLIRHAFARLYSRSWAWGKVSVRGTTKQSGVGKRNILSAA